MKSSLTHITNLWATITVKTLIMGGVRHFCVAPGSRSAPLTLALVQLKASYQDIVLHTHFDERGLGFFALGISKSCNFPVAVITTSGTAVPNLYPAVVESYQTQSRLIILSADRPPELLSCGANQAIQQQHLFGNNVVHYQQLELPSETTPIQHLVDQVSHSLDVATGNNSPLDSGPVHINCPYREPLYGTEDLKDYSSYIAALTDEGPSARTATGSHDHSAPTHHWALAGVIIAGNLSPTESTAVLALSRSTGWPIIADITSQLRLNTDVHILHYSDLLMANTEASALLNSVEQVVQFGGRLTSKRVNQWLRHFKGHYIIVSRHRAALDPHHKATQIHNDINQYCEQVSHKGPLSPETEQLLGLNQRIDGFLDDILGKEFGELSIVRALTQIIPKSTALFTGNSLAIRLVDMFATPLNGSSVYSNRGASGIDGLLATAIGCSQHHPKGLTLLLGDLSLLHDLNSLALAAKQQTPLVIVVLNNDGGSIFNLLPVDGLADVKETFFQCPHGLDFEGVCKMFSIEYLQPSNLNEFKNAYRGAFDNNGSTLIEIKVPSDQATNQLRQIVNQVSSIS